MNKKNDTKTVFIACSSRDEINHNYHELAENISDLFIKEGYDLAFGAATSGMMGKSYKTFKRNNKNIFSYTVEKYRDDLENNLKDTFCYMYQNTFQRTEALYKKADIIIFLPGGTGTLSELFACLEENRTTSLPKKIILFNYNNFFEPIIDFIHYCVTNHFNSESIYDYFHICNTEEEIKQIIIPQKKKELTLK